MNFKSRMASPNTSAPLMSAGGDHAASKMRPSSPAALPAGRDAALVLPPFSDGLPAAEAFLAGKPLTDENMAQAGQLALENANPRSNPLRGSREYRLDTLPVIIRRALEACRDQLAH